MENLKIKVTSNSTPESIQKDFQNCQQITKLDLSLEIQVDQEELILKSIMEQIHQIICLKDIFITIQPFCILEYFQTFTEGLSTLKFIKQLAVKFSSTCFAGVTQFKHLASAIKKLSLLTNLQILVDEKNYFDESQIALLCECFSSLKELTTLKIQISHGNSFSNRALIVLSQGLAKISSNLKDLSLSLDFQNIDSEGTVEFSRTIKILKQLNKLELTLLNKYSTDTSISRVFESISTLSQLKSLHIDPQNTLLLKSSELERIVLSLSNLIELESLSLKNVFGKQETFENQLLMKTLSNLTKLKYLDTEMINFNLINFDNINGSSDYLNKLVNLVSLTLEVNDTDNTRDNQFVSILSKSMTQMKELSSMKITFKCKTEKAQSLSLTNSFKELKNLKTLDLLVTENFYLDEEIYNSLGQSLLYPVELKSFSLQIKHSYRRFYLENTTLNKKRFLESLAQLSQLEELQLKGILIQKQENKTLTIALQKLGALKKLKIETSFDFTQTKITKVFSKSFNKLKNLTDLSLIVYHDMLSKSKNNLNFFNSVAQLQCLQHLRLQIEFYDLIIFQSLRNAVSSLNQLTSVEIVWQQCSFLSLNYVVSGFKSSELKQLTLSIQRSTYDEETDHLDNIIINMFEGIPNLEEFKFITNQIQVKFDFGSILFRALSKIRNLTSIELISSFYYNLFTIEGYQSLNHYLKQQQNLLSFKLKADLPFNDSKQALNLLGEGLEQQMNLRVLETNLRDVNNNIFSFIKSTASMRNLRQNNIKIGFKNKHDDQTQMLKFNSDDSNNMSKYLTELVLCFGDFELEGDIFVNAFWNIRHYKYLNHLSLSINDQPPLTNNAISVLGLSLQCLQNLQTLILKFSLHNDISSEATLQLANGIRCQQQLKQLVLHIDQEYTNEPNRLHSIAQSIKYLTNLEIIEIIYTTKDFISNKQAIIDFIEILGKSIADHNHLKVLELKIDDLSDQFQNQMISLGNYIQSNNNLQKVKFELKAESEVSCEGTVSLSQGISHLRQLQDLYIVFGQKKKISNQELLNLAENLKQLESLRKIKLELFETAGQNPVLVNTIINSIAQLKLLEKVDLSFHNFCNEEQNPLEIESILKSRQVQSFVEGKFASSAATISESETLSNDITLKNEGFVFSLKLTQQIKQTQKDYLLQIQKLAEHIPINYKTTIILTNILTNNLDDFAKIMSQIKSKELCFALNWNENLSSGLKDILQAISQMINLTKLDLNLTGNKFSNQLIIDSVSPLSNCLKLKHLNITHDDSIAQKLDLSNFNQYLKALSQSKNLYTLIVHSIYFTNKFKKPAFRLINRLQPKLIHFVLYNEGDSASDISSDEEPSSQTDNDEDDNDDDEMSDENDIDVSNNLNENMNNSFSKNEDEEIQNEDYQLIEEEKGNEGDVDDEDLSKQELENSDHEGDN